MVVSKLFEGEYYHTDYLGIEGLKDINKAFDALNSYLYNF
jgi:hypothetical protein